MSERGTRKVREEFVELNLELRTVSQRVEDGEKGEGMDSDFGVPEAVEAVAREITLYWYTTCVAPTIDTNRQ